MDRRTAVILTLTALLPAPAFGQTAPMAAPSADPRGGPLSPVEQAFYERASRILRQTYPNPAAAEKAGYFRYTNEDRTGAISYENPNYFNTPEVQHPQQLWFDVNGRLLGADFSQAVVTYPQPTLFGIGTARFHHIPLHVHYGLRQPNGTIRYGVYVTAADFRAAGLDPLNAKPADLVKLGKATSVAQVAFVFSLLENWDAQMWVVPNPNGQFADANPNVHPSPTQGGGSGEQRT